MLVALIIVIIVSVVLIGGALIYAHVAGHVATDNRKEINQLKESFRDQGVALADAEKKLEEYDDLNCQLAAKNSRIEELNLKITSAELAMKDLESRIMVLNAVADEKDKEIKRRVDELNKSSQTIKELRHQVSSEMSMQELESRIDMLNQRELELKGHVEDWKERGEHEKTKCKKLEDDSLALEQTIKELEGQCQLSRDAAQKALDDKEKVLADLEKWRRTMDAVVELEKAEKEKSEGVLEVPDGWWSRISELEKVMREIGLDDKTIRSVHQAIWTSVWLPRIKEVGKKWKGVSGIYKLTSLDDENRCYVGQATDIENRWRQHVKKMVGVEDKGDEKLYEMRPDRLRWEVLETGEGKEWLNDREKWWIDSLRCVEIGFNMKR